MPRLTEVCLTVDTEFSIGGAFAHPTKLRPIGEPHAYCPAEGKEHGLPFILSTLARFGFPATFFVETLSTAYFGDDPLRRIGDRPAGAKRAGMPARQPFHPIRIAEMQPVGVQMELDILSGGKDIEPGWSRSRG